MTSPFTLTDTLPADALTGIHVVNLAVNVPGPWAAARLADLGARVTSVQPPSGDPLETYSTTWYAELSGPAELRTIDLKSASGSSELGELLHDAHLVITSHRPAALERLGITAMIASLPGLSHVEIVGDCENPEHPGHDLTYQAAAGTLQPPHLPSVLLGDLMGAERAVSAALALLLQAQRTGAGGHARVGLRQAALAATTPLRHGVTAPGGLLGGGIAEYNLYPTSDGWVAAAALEPHFAARLAEAVAAERVGASQPLPGNDEPRLDKAAAAEFFAARTTAELLEWARAHDVPIEAVQAPNSQATSAQTPETSS